MEVMKFPTKFINWIKSQYMNPNALIINNNKVISGIVAEKSVRQGCPLAMQLFIIFIDPLINKLNEQLKGISCLNKKIKVRAMVDDVTIFIDNQEDITLATSIIDKFCLVSGSTLNKNKFQIMGIGSWINKKNWSNCSFNSCNEINLLGINFCASGAPEKSWEKIVNKIQFIILQGKRRKFSLFEKVDFIKSFVLSKAIYTAKIILCPVSISNIIQKMCEKFLWIGYIKRPSKDVLYSKKEAGGLNVPNVKCFFDSLLTKNIYKTWRGEVCPEKRLADFWLSHKLRNWITLEKGRNIPREIMMFPPHFIIACNNITNIFEKNPLSAFIKEINHRTLYIDLINITDNHGKIQKRFPLLPWKKMWFRCNKLPLKYRDSMFLLLQDLYLPKATLFKFGMISTDLCDQCSMQETNNHVMFQCVKRSAIFDWCLTELNNLNCYDDFEKCLFLNFTDNVNDKELALLIAVYTSEIWKGKYQNRIPSIQNMNQKWITAKEEYLKKNINKI